MASLRYKTLSYLQLPFSRFEVHLKGNNQSNNQNTGFHIFQKLFPIHSFRFKRLYSRIIKNLVRKIKLRFSKKFSIFSIHSSSNEWRLIMTKQLLKKVFFPFLICQKWVNKFFFQFFFSLLSPKTNALPSNLTL